MAGREHNYTAILDAAIEADMAHSSPHTRRVVEEAERFVTRVKSAVDELVYGGPTRDLMQERRQLGMETKAR
jgi:hypothetical protein